MRNLTQATRRAEDVAEDGLHRKRAEAKAQAIFDEMRGRLEEREFHHFRNHLAVLLGYRRHTVGVRFSPKERAKEAAEKLFYMASDRHG